MLASIRSLADRSLASLKLANTGEEGGRRLADSGTCGRLVVPGAGAGEPDNLKTACWLRSSLYFVSTKSKSHSGNEIHVKGLLATSFIPHPQSSLLAIPLLLFPT